MTNREATIGDKVTHKVTGFTAPLQMVWHAPKKRDGCGRDPAAGPAMPAIHTGETK